MFSELKTKAITIMMKGFNNSIGWNLGKKKKSNHRLEPFTSMPIIGTNKSEMKQTKNKKIENLNKYFCSNAEKNTTKKNPITM